MAGIYIHIPFCKTRCIYCAFFSTTSLDKRDAYVEALCRELADRRDYLRGEAIETIYFGGGTPSQLTIEQISRILKTISNIYNVRAKAEITFEGNPDDLSIDYLNALRSIGINRLSMGVQSFDDSRLRFIHRRHSAQQAREAVANAVFAGFSNISIDLMFGFPDQTLEEWKTDVLEALSMPVQHVSAYSLMYDEGTVLADMLDRGDVSEIDDELSLLMYQYLVSALKSAGFEHYEISNFCRPGYQSRHNSGYWQGIPYLGVGAGAHSYDGTSRQYNVESLSEYMSGANPVKEELNKFEQYNEFVFTSLRTCQGLSMGNLLSRFGIDLYNYCLRNAKKHIALGLLSLSSAPEQVLCLTENGVFVSNDVISDLMWVD